MIDTDSIKSGLITMQWVHLTENMIPILAVYEPLASLSI